MTFVRILVWPYLIAASACGASRVDGLATAECSSPAPILNSRDARAPDIYVAFTSGTDGSAATARLQQSLGFTIKWIPTGAAGFLANLTDQQIAVIRCDGAVAFLEWDSLAAVGSLRRLTINGFPQYSSSPSDL